MIKNSIMKKSGILLLFIYITIYSFSQEIVLKEGKKYDKAKITLKDGQTIRSDLFVKDSKIEFSMFRPDGSKFRSSAGIDDIENIQIPVKNHMWHGGAAGLGLGIIAMIIIENHYERDRDGAPPSEIPWHADGYSSTHETITTYTNSGQAVLHSSESYQYDMAFTPKLFIVAGSACIGLIVGASIKKWQNAVFKKTSWLERLDYNYSYQKTTKSNQFSMTYRF